MPSNFNDNLQKWDQDKEPNLLQYCREVGDVFPFSDLPSGSKWGRAELDWLNIRHEWECDLRQLVNKKSELEESGTVIPYLQGKLDLPWDQMSEGEHRSGSLYDRLLAIASEGRPTLVYIDEPVLPSSSQNSDTSEILHRTHGISRGDTSEMLYRTHGISPRDKVARPISEASPSGSPKSRPAPSQASEPWSEPSSPNEDAQDGDLPSSPPALPAVAIEGSSPETRLEKEVEWTAMAFLHIIVDAFRSTEVVISKKEKAEQDLKYEFLAPRTFPIKIDGLEIKSHPDIAVHLLAKGTFSELNVEAKRFKHGLTEVRLLGQQVSELLGATLRYRSTLASRKEYYIAYLISWHHLKCYVSKMEVTEKYLNTLSVDSNNLHSCLPPTVQQSRTFDMKDPDQRIVFAKLIVRTGIQLLYEYPNHRGNATGLTRRLRGVTPSKIV